MAVKLHIKEAFERFQDREDIQLVEYNGWSKNSLFYDKVIQEHFTALPNNVYKRKSSHPRRTNESISLERAKERFSTRDDVELVEYNGWSKKSKFYDLIADEHWWAIPAIVYANNSASQAGAGTKISRSRTNNGSTIDFTKR